MQDITNRITMSYSDWELGNHVTVERTNLDHLPDVLEQFLAFLNGMGYDFVKKVVVVQSDGSERSTQ